MPNTPDKFNTPTLEAVLDSPWRFKQSNDTVWLPATVPGCVHLDLIANGTISDPFYSTNEREAQWIETRNWEYRTEFHCPLDWVAYENLELEFAGLDTYAEVYLNGELILRADNMFVGWRAPIRERLRPGKTNELHIIFQSPVNHTLPLYESSRFRYPAVNDQAAKQVSVYTRKAPYHFGWDWGPRLVTSGIWRPIRVHGWNSFRINDFQVRQLSLSQEEARLELALEVSSQISGKAEVNWKISDENSTNRRRETIQLQTGLNELRIPFTLPHPKLWWPNGLGSQHLYRAEAELAAVNETATASQRFGLRTIEVINEQDALGESFFVQVNGVPVFMKGANYVPPDSFPPRVTHKHYRRLFKDMVDANYNMLRVWGGGYYEDDYFYDLADEHGILIWQDFMFACSLYPFDAGFLKNIEREAVYNVKRLRRHPSLALWCGNNEIAVAWKEWGWQNEYGYSGADKKELEKGYAAIFDEILPKTVRRYDPGRFYFPSSPISGWGSPQEFTRGDNHFWGVWHGEWPLEDYQTYIPRFMSEYGFQSFPDIVTTQRFAAPEDFDIYSEVMQHHQRCRKGNGLIKRYMDEWYRPPRDFPSFLYLSHLLQAEAMKIAIEAHRRAMPYCMGTLYWQFNDCWPGPSWAGVDYYGRWKALHYKVRRAFAPVLVTGQLEGGRLSVYVVSDELRPRQATLKITHQTFTSQVLWQTEKPILIAANSSRLYFDEMLANFSDWDNPASLFHLELNDGKRKLSENVVYLTKPLAMNLPAPQMQWIAEHAENGAKVYLQTGALAKDVYLLLPGDENSFFSDNYFDLLPGQETVVNLRTDFAIDEITDKLQIQTLRDTYHSS